MKPADDFTTYAHRRWETLVRSAVLLGCTVHEAEDLVQTALLRCHLAWERVTRANDVDAYVYRVLVNCYTDSRRRRWWRERPTSELPEPVAATDVTELIAVEDVVHRALGHLSAANRAVVVLRFYAHLSEGQIAQVLGIAPGTVKSRLSRALTQLATDSHLADLTDGSNS